MQFGLQRPTVTFVNVYNLILRPRLVLCVCAYSEFNNMTIMRTRLISLAIMCHFIVICHLLNEKVSN